jgi:hypothetical protein
MAASVGDRVRIERDETRYPSKGTWPEFRGRTGTIVEINVDRKHPHLTEYGVAFGKVSSAGKSAKRTHNWEADSVTWFKDYEMSPLAAERHSEHRFRMPDGKDTRYDLKGAA